jgi:adenine phosphoribosyltransferase
LALELGVGFVPLRKQGKLPCRTYTETYELEYGTTTLEVHYDALSSSDRVLIVDDVLATGGTARAAARLVKKSGARVYGLAFLIELSALGGRALLAGHEVSALIAYT